MLHPIAENLSKINLFKNLTIEKLESIIKSKNSEIKDYKKKEIIFFRGQKFEYLLVLIFGEVITEMNDFNGKVVQVERIKAPSLLAPGFLFNSKNCSPVDILADSRVTILKLEKSYILQLCKDNDEFLENFLKIVSNKLTFLSEKLYLNSLKTIKEKIIFYLISLYNSQNKANEIILPISLEELSHLFGVARPSLSREFINLEKEGLIMKNNNKIKILNKEELLLNKE